MGGMRWKEGEEERREATTATASSAAAPALASLSVCRVGLELRIREAEGI